MSNPYRAYLESKVLSASPLELVHLALDGAIQALEDARAHLKAKRIPERSKSVTKAQLIVAELQKSLDFEKGGDLALQFARLYDYIQRRRIDGNFQQADEPLAEAQRLLLTLDEAWQEIGLASTAAAFATASPWSAASEVATQAQTRYSL